MKLNASGKYFFKNVKLDIYNGILELECNSSLEFDSRFYFEPEYISIWVLRITTNIHTVILSRLNKTDLEKALNLFKEILKSLKGK
jgi:muramidase (phage lysozyme)